MLLKPYKRVLVKLSGEALLGDGRCGFDYKICEFICQILWDIRKSGIEVGVVIGGGNIFRGQSALEFGFERTPADNIGILATCINGLALHQVFISMGVKARVMSSRNFDGIIQQYNWQETKLLLEDDTIVIFVGGTGNPYFTTDTAAALRGCEIGADVLIKLTKVDGVYDKDPIKDLTAVKFDHLTYEEALKLGLQVMDATAIALCRDNNLDIRVVNLFSKKDIMNAIIHQHGGTLITKKAE